MIKAQNGDVTIRVEIDGINATVEILDPVDPVLDPLASAIEFLLERHLERLHYTPDVHQSAVLFLEELGWDILISQPDPQEEPPADAVF